MSKNSRGQRRRRPNGTTQRAPGVPPGLPILGCEMRCRLGNCLAPRLCPLAGPDPDRRRGAGNADLDVGDLARRADRFRRRALHSLAAGGRAKCSIGTSPSTTVRFRNTSTPFVSAFSAPACVRSCSAILRCLALLIALLYYALRQVSRRSAATAACLVFVLLFAFAQFVGIGNYNYVCPYSHEMTHGLMLSLLAVVAAWPSGRAQPASGRSQADWPWAWRS